MGTTQTLKVENFNKVFELYLQRRNIMGNTDYFHDCARELAGATIYNMNPVCSLYLGVPYWKFTWLSSRDRKLNDFRRFVDATIVYDENGFDRDGLNHMGFNRDGYDKNGYDIDGYNQEGYDEFGYNEDGYDKLGDRQYE